MISIPLAGLVGPEGSASTGARVYVIAPRLSLADPISRCRIGQAERHPRERASRNFPHSPTTPHIFENARRRLVSELLDLGFRLAEKGFARFRRSVPRTTEQRGRRAALRQQLLARQRL